MRKPRLTGRSRGLAASFSLLLVKRIQSYLLENYNKKNVFIFALFRSAAMLSGFFGRI
jgi:hypothetical protein